MAGLLEMTVESALCLVPKFGQGGTNVLKPLFGRIAFRNVPAFRKVSDE